MSETQSFKSLTVVIPTYNREDLLAKALAGYLAQSSPQLIHELLIVDDGSTDGTESKVREISGRAPFPVRYLRQANRGPAAARNLGIREARSNLVLFTDSDIIPKRDLVEQHMECHKRNPQINTAVLGYVTWSPEVNATPFMRWYGEFGLFGYGQLRKRKKVTFHFFYTCNLSLKTDFLRTYGQFDEDFKGAAFEDIELAYRLTKHGLNILYNPAAAAYHHQFFSFQAACRKEREKEPASRVFLRKEAGRQLTEENQRRTSHIRYLARKGAAKKLASALVRTLALARPLLDSHVPLPYFVYKLFLWYEVTHGGYVGREVASHAPKFLGEINSSSMQESSLPMKRCSIASVTVAYNGERVLANHLGSLNHQTRKLDEIIVVNNASTDDTLSLLAREYPEVTVLDQPENAGVGGGFSAGLAYAALNRRHDWVWLFDQDSVPAVDGLERLLAGLQQLDGTAEATAILAPVCTHSETGLPCLGLSWRGGRLLPTAGDPQQAVAFVDSVISAGSLVRREAVEAVGLPRADFFMDFVDHEHCLRLRRHGYQIAVVRDSVLHHTLGDPSKFNILGRTKYWTGHPPWREYYMIRNEVFTIWKYYPKWNIKVLTIYRLTRHALDLLLLGKRKLQCLRMMLRGFLDGRAGRLGVRFGQMSQARND